MKAYQQAALVQAERLAQELRNVLQLFESAAEQDSLRTYGNDLLCAGDAASLNHLEEAERHIKIAIVLIKDPNANIPNPSFNPVEV